MPDELRRVLEHLGEEEETLILCNYELYGGRWDLLRQDLVDRLAGRPYVFQLGEKIKEDLERVTRLEAIEKQFGVKLSDFVSL